MLSKEEYQYSYGNLRNAMKDICSSCKENERCKECDIFNDLHNFRQLIHDHFELLEETKTKCSSLIRQNKILKKALDKACDKLSTVIEIEGCNLFCGNSLDCCCDEYDCSMSEWWKEWSFQNNDLRL